jgi:hypothetical protein
MGDIYDPKFVMDVFDRCSDRYVAFSLILSFGFTERWRRQCVAAMPTPPTDRAHGYDLMAGTGEVWPHLLKRFDDIESITAVDISSGMHRHAMERLHVHQYFFGCATGVAGRKIRSFGRQNASQQPGRYTPTSVRGALDLSFRAEPRRRNLSIERACELARRTRGELIRRSSAVASAP